MTKIRSIGNSISRRSRDERGIKLTTFIPLKFKKRGGRTVIVHPQTGEAQSPQANSKPVNDLPLSVALSRAFHWQRLLDEGYAGSGSDIAKQEGLHHSTVNELLRLTLLAPDIIQSILAGTQPKCMSLLWFQRNPLPLKWDEQRRIIQGFDAWPENS